MKAHQDAEAPDAVLTRSIAGGQFVGLREISLASTKLAVLPPAVGRLIDVENLDVSFNPLSELPPTFPSMKSLRALFCMKCQFKVIPSLLGPMQSLQVLS